MTAPAHDEDALPTVSEVQARRIPWETYSHASLITHGEMELICRYDSLPPERRPDMLKEVGIPIASTLLSLAKGINKEETVQYIVTLASDILREHENAKLFYKAAAENPQLEGFTPFVRLLTRTDWYTLMNVTEILARLLSPPPGVELPQLPEPIMNSHLSVFIEFLIAQLWLSRPTRLLTVTSALQFVLRIEQSRSIFVDNRGLEILNNLMSSKQNVQVLYQCGFCLWLISYSKRLIPSILESGLVRTVSHTLKQVAKEKVVRILIESLLNIVHGAESTHSATSVLVDAGILRLLPSLQERHWSEEDLTDDIKTLREDLEADVRELTTFEMYRQEVMSGELEWSAMHNDRQFWVENISKFVNNDYQVLQQLIRLLMDDDTVKVAIACHDIGEFIRYHPQGKDIIQKLDAKEKLMTLMTHENGEVSKQALLCVQKMMVSNWEFLQSSSGPSTN